MICLLHFMKMNKFCLFSISNTNFKTRKHMKVGLYVCVTIKALEPYCLFITLFSFHREMKCDGISNCPKSQSDEKNCPCWAEFIIALIGLSNLWLCLPILCLVGCLSDCCKSECFRKFGLSVLYFTG